MRAEFNPYVGLNYLDVNSKMAVPPTYWLARLYDFDDQLVVFPSFAHPYAYVLARRRRLSGGLTDQALEATMINPDTKLALQHGLVPVSLIYRTGTAWTIDNIIADLKSRDMWAVGSPDKVADNLDEADNSAEKKLKAGIRDDMWNRSGDAWRSYQARTGQRNQR
jgi:hypothetical protein